LRQSDGLHPAERLAEPNGPPCHHCLESHANSHLSPNGRHVSTRGRPKCEQARTMRFPSTVLMVGMILSQPLGDISPPVSLLDIIKSSKYSVISPHFSMLIKSHNSLALHRQFVLEMVTPISTSSQEPGGQLCMRYDWLFSPPHLFLLPILLRVCFSQTVLDRTCYAQP